MLKLIELWSANAPGRSARSRPLAAARGAIPPRTRTIGIDGLQNVFDNVELTDLI